MLLINSHSRYRLAAGSKVRIRKPGEEWRDHVTSHENTFDVDVFLMTKASPITLVRDGWELQCHRNQLNPCRSICSLKFEFLGGGERISQLDDHGKSEHIRPQDENLTLLHVKAGDTLLCKEGKRAVKTVKIYRSRPPVHDHLGVEVVCGLDWLQEEGKEI